MTSFLLSGFEPFDGAQHNSSKELVEGVHEMCAMDGKIQVECCILPVVQDEAWLILQEKIHSSQPVAVLAFGQSNRKGIHLEYRAQNINLFRIPDNAGHQPTGSVIVKGGPRELFTSLPVDLLFRSLKKKGVDISISHDAGTFVCNNLFYHMQSTSGQTIPCGFIHLPFDCSPSLIEDVYQLLKELMTIIDGT